MNLNILRQIDSSIMSSDTDRPRFAVIRLKPESNLLGLFQLLLCNGFGEVAFVKNLNDCNFGGNKEISNLTSSSAAVAAVQQKTNYLDDFGLENGGSTTTTNSKRLGGIDHAAKQSIILENSIQKLIDAKKQRLAQSKPEKQINRGTDFETLNFSFNQSHRQYEKSISPALPLSTFSCPLPLPVDRSTASKSHPDPSKSHPSTKPKNYPSTNLHHTTTIVSTRPIVQRTKQDSPTISNQQNQNSSPSQFVQCQLCQSKIMATRFSNLTNHVRRHAPVKQFQCVYCDYAHNEIAKVRLHMNNNHGDKKSRPLNNINTDMQEAWRQLMRDCFPERCKKQKPLRPLPPATGNEESKMISATAIVSTEGASILSSTSIHPEKSIKSEKSDIMTLAALNAFSLEEEASDDEGDFQFAPDHHNIGGEGLRFARCDQCYVYVDVNMKENHVRTCHLENVPSTTYVCSICDYENSDRRQVEIHNRLEHDESQNAEIRSIDADLSSYVDQMIEEYFPVHALEYTSNFDDTKIISSGNSNNEFENMIFNHSFPMIGNGFHQSIVGYADHHHSYGRKMNCRICCRRVDAYKTRNHAKRHLKRSGTIFGCPLCEKYRSPSGKRIRKHVATRHGYYIGQWVPKVLRRIQIPSTGSENAMSRVVKRCFGIQGPDYKKRYAYRKLYGLTRK